MADTRQTAVQLKQLFGNYRAEWLQNQIFELFTEPSYFPELETQGPCILVGGRGTGKTTVLRTLSYEGKFALSRDDVSSISTWSYFGCYYRVDTNHVRAFEGPELRDESWARVFSHYINLLLCGQVLQFLEWYYERLPACEPLSAAACQRVGVSLHLGPTNSLRQLVESLSDALLRFEAFINNLSEDRLPPLSIPGGPIKELITRVRELPQFSGKYFFFLIDEYENFSDRQQTIVNTLVKHSGDIYSFKIGVKELGWRVRGTVNPDEQLISPADYVRVDIGEKLGSQAFADFARSICNQRISKIDSNLKIENLLPNLTEDQEAEILGINGVLATKLKSYQIGLSSFEGLSPLEVYFCFFLAEARSLSIQDILSERSRDLNKWRHDYGNYKHALLFTIRRGLSGIRKYYAGWTRFLQLSGSNIRYLLALVDETLMQAAQDKEKPFGAPIPPEIQTRAAQAVGKRNVGELEGLSVHGAQLTRLVLGLGRIFEVMASQLEGHAPEVNQFAIANRKTESDPAFDPLLRSAIMHLALLRTTSTKRGRDNTDLKSFDYLLHPIFAPFFVYSHRRKRKMKLSEEQLLELVGPNATATISAVLKENGRVKDDENLPEQLVLFGQYYGIRDGIRG